MGKIIKLCCILFLGASVVVHAKPMSHRLGLGIKNNISIDLPSVAVVYHNTDNMALTGGFGVDTEKNNSKMQIHAGVRNVIFQENQLHFYAGGQIGYVSSEVATVKESGFEAQLIMGTEFFFQGLENVGFSFEGGLGLSTVNNTRVRTVASSPFQAGIIFYF